MKFLYSFITILTAALMFGSCTPITSKNQPGVNQTKFPKSMIGKFDLYYPDGLSPDGGSVGTVIISENSMTMTTESENSVTPLGDSLFLSTIGKNYYLCMGAAPSFSVFKVVVGKKELKFYTMSSEEFITKEDLQKYFSDVEEITTVDESEDDSSEPVESVSYSVTIDDSKLEDFFSSSIPSKNPFILKKKAKK